MDVKLNVAWLRATESCALLAQKGDRLGEFAGGEVGVLPAFAGTAEKAGAVTVDLGRDS